MADNEDPKISVAPVTTAKFDASKPMVAKTESKAEVSTKPKPPVAPKVEAPKAAAPVAAPKEPVKAEIPVKAAVAKSAVVAANPAPAVAKPADSKSAAVAAQAPAKAPIAKAKPGPKPKPKIEAASVAPKAAAPVVPAKVASAPAVAVKPAPAKEVVATAPVPKAATPNAAPKTAPKPASKPDAGKPVFAGLFSNFMLEETNMDMSANFTGFQDAISEAQTKAKAAFDKGTSVLGEVSDFAKGNVEACVESGKIYAEGVQALGSEFVTESRAAFEKISGDVKELAAAKSPTDFFKLQSDLVRKNFDTAVAYSSKNSEAMLKLFNDTFAPISGRVSLAVEKARSTTATSF